MHVNARTFRQHTPAWVLCGAVSHSEKQRFDYYAAGRVDANLMTHTRPTRKTSVRFSGDHCLVRADARLLKRFCARANSRLLLARALDLEDGGVDGDRNARRTSRRGTGRQYQRDRQPPEHCLSPAPSIPRSADDGMHRDSNIEQPRVGSTHDSVRGVVTSNDRVEHASCNVTSRCEESLGPISDHLDLDLGINHQLGLGRRSRRLVVGEAFGIDAVERPEVARVVEPHRDFDNVLQRASG